VISKIPNTLHTPLLSGTNAIHGIVLLGGLLLLGLNALGGFSEFLLVIAVAFGTINIVGGFLVTDRMLEMFKRKPEKPPVTEQERTAQTPPASSTDGKPGGEGDGKGGT
jgi:proton-translocating NAD(P)+ transhydrogenase subunit alpha